MESAAALKAEGTRAWQAGDVQQATTLYADALALIPATEHELRAKLHGNLYLCKKKGGTWLLASLHAQSACTLLPMWAKAHAYLAEAKCKLRQWGAAKDAAQRGLACSPDADALRFLRKQLAEADREGSAKFACCDPDNEREIVDLLARFQRAEGDVDKEVVMIRRQPAAGYGEGNFGWTNVNFLHVAAWHGDGRLVDALAAAGAAINYPTLPTDTHQIKFAGGASEASGGVPVRIVPAPAGLTPLVLSCAMLAFYSLCDLMGDVQAEMMADRLSPDAAIRLVALGADLKQTLTLPSDAPMDSVDPSTGNLMSILWQQLGLVGKTALQLALVSCDASLISECVARGAAITAREVEACPPPMRSRVRTLVGQCTPAAPNRLPADVYDCRCGSRLPWSHCHGHDKQVHIEGDATRSHGSRMFLRYPPTAPCPCKTNSNPPYYECCWEGPHAWFGDDATGATCKVVTCDRGQWHLSEQFREMRLAEGAAPDGPAFPARDAQGRSLGRPRTDAEQKQFTTDGIRSGTAFEVMAEAFGPKCQVASLWDREVVAGVVELIENEFTWVDTHWAIPAAELLTRVEEWNDALRRYLDRCDLSEHDRSEIRRRHTASPLAPCANPACCAVETQTKEFQKCVGCKRVAYCSSACQVDDWMSGHQQRCCVSIDAVGRSLDATRTRAHAWRLLEAAKVSRSDGSARDADGNGDALIQRLLAVMVLMRELPAQERSLTFFIEAAAALATLTRSESVAFAASELELVVSLWGSEAPDSIRRALEQLREREKPEESRPCKSCGRNRGRAAFSQNQWRRGQRRCIECQQGGVLVSVDELERQVAEEEDRAAMAALYAEGIAKERARIQEEVARRNACERSDHECAICFDETDVGDRRAMPCNSRHWLCKGCLDVNIEHANRSGAASLNCHLCRMPIALVAFQTIWTGGAVSPETGSDATV